MIGRDDLDARPSRALTSATALRWSAAAMLVVAAHAGAAWLAVRWEAAEAAPGAPPPAVMIELAPLAAAPPTPPQAVAPGPQAVEAEPEPAPEPPTPAENALPEPEPPPLREPAATAEPKPAPISEVEVPDLPKQDRAEAVLAPRPLPPPRPKELAEPPPRRDPAQRKPMRRDRREVRRTTAPPAFDASRAAVAAAPASGRAAAPSISPATWKSELMARLNRYKRYPPGASGAGTASVAFTIDRSGQVLAARLIASSGDRLLDREAVALPRRASPVPVPPPDLGRGRSLTLTVPIRFSR